jgi:hypothetical protein
VVIDIFLKEEHLCDKLMNYFDIFFEKHFLYILFFKKRKMKKAYSRWIKWSYDSLLLKHFERSFYRKIARLLLYKITSFDQLIWYKFVIKIIHLWGGVETFGPPFNTRGYVVLVIWYTMKDVSVPLVYGCECFLFTILSASSSTS